MFTDRGSLCELTFVIKADARADIKRYSFVGGQGVGISEIFTIYQSTNPSNPVAITSVEITASDGLAGFVEVDGTTLKLASTVKDLSGKLQVKAKWGNNYYTFTIKGFTITKNITPQGSLTFTGNIGGETRQFDLSDILAGTITNGTIGVTFGTNSAIQSATGPDNNKKISITFNQVGRTTETTVPVTVTITSPFDETKPTQITFNVVFVIEPSVTLSASYPNPTDSQALNVEYIESGTTFANFKTDFLEGKAIFAGNTRIVPAYAERKVNNVVEYGDTQPTTDFTLQIQVIIQSMTNAEVKQGPTGLRVNSKIDTSANSAGVTFTRGASGGTSQVVLSISYNNYVISYTVEILSSAFAVTVNQATNNISADDSGQYELLYVDKTNSRKLLANNRMMQATLSTSAVAGNYYIFFIPKTNLAASTVKDSKIVNLTEQLISLNRGSTIYIDLGINNLGAKDNYTPVMLSESAYQSLLESSDSRDGAVQQIINQYNTASPGFTNYFNTCFTNYTLTSRVKLTYAGIEVAYDNFSGILKYKTSTNSTGEGLSTTPLNIASDATIGTATEAITGFILDTGTGTAVLPAINKTFNVTYRYMPDIDIEVATVANNEGYVRVEANQSIKMVQAFGVRRKTTQALLQMADMVSSDANFNLQVPDESNEITGTAVRYLGISPIRTDETDEDQRTTYDWEIRGNGADNDGQKVNLTLTYSVGSFSKTFGLQVEVVNDYRITFDGSTNATTETSGGTVAVSNQSRPYVINTSEFDSATSRLMAGEQVGSTAPYLSITHRNDSNMGERSVLDFDYTLTKDQPIGDTTYNIANNITSKLNDFNGGSWTGSGTSYTWSKGSNTSLTLSLNKVYFGSQYYRIQLVDDYVFTVYLYFTLDSGTEDPEIYTDAGDSSISITEGETVAFGAQYETLTVTANNGEPLPEGGGGIDLTITTRWSTPRLTDEDSNVSKIISIRNIDAWGFDQNYYNATYEQSSLENVPYFGGSGFTATTTSGYYINDENQVGKFKIDDKDYIFTLSDAKSHQYLTLPNFRFVTIDSVSYYYNNNGTLEKVGETSSSLGKNLATASSDNLHHASSTIYKSASACSFTLPSVARNRTWIYGNANQVDLTMVVRLKYNNNSNTEYFDISQNVTLSKTTQVSDQNNLVADHTLFNLTDYINVTASGSDSSNYTIYDDTLAVAVNANSRTTFTVSYGGTEVSRTISNANYGWKRLYYVSLSEMLNTVLTYEDEVTITPGDDNATFYYGVGTTDGDNIPVDTSNPITITTITQDAISISNKNDLQSGIMGTYQYYVIQNGTNPAPAYRYRALFNVTGRYQSVYAPTTIRTLQVPAGNNSVDVAIAQWADGVKYTTIGASYQLSFTKVEEQNTFSVSPVDSGTSINSVKVNGTTVSGSGNTFTIPTEITTGSEVVVTADADFKITYDNVTYANSYRAELKEFDLKNYNGNNLYFVITSGESGGGGTGMATIDSANGTITLLPGFTEDHYVTVEVYQKVSGIDGNYPATKIADMYQLASLRIYPASATQTGANGAISADLLQNTVGGGR